jgi:FAD/FMN-containing dehydrogenase
MRLGNWGRYPVIETRLYAARDADEAAALLAQTPELIARGLGRCYGDSSLNERAVLDMTGLNHVLSFDPASGLLEAEAGVSLGSLVEDFLPRGFFLPVTPGTRFVTLGGALASDVHGKNHHRAGTFCRHVLWLDVLTADGRVIRCSREREAPLFHATCGGMGLTGLILRAALRLLPVSSAWIRRETVKAVNLEAVMDDFEASSAWTYSVAWIDCLQSGAGLGRSVLLRGEHARPEELPGRAGADPLCPRPGRALNVPVDLPGFTLNRFTARAFNALYYGRAPKGTRAGLVPLENFFYPLDAVDNWNRIYGRRGFIQYQFILPLEAGRDGLRGILELIARAGLGSFLAVLKLCGPQEHPAGNISFPDTGYSLALDFPLSRELPPLLERLDDVVHDLGGRLYLSKDARMSAGVFARGYKALLPSFLAVKAAHDPDNRFCSLQSKRLLEL